MTDPTTVFALPERLAAKASPRLVGRDADHLALVADTVGQQVATLAAELDTLRRAPGGRGRGALDRDLEIHRLSGRLGVLRRFGRDLCLGRTVPADGSAPTYIGRIGVTDPAGEPLLVDWRAPAAEPYFAATAARPMGLASRRRYRWRAGRIVDYWDDAFVATGEDEVALDDDSAFIASLGASRSPRMRDVLATIQADQDAAIRADSAGALVVDGGPGTGKTVVALHRAAYLLYADPRLEGHRGGVLFIGPHESYLGYVADVLPGLGEDGVQTCTLRDLVPEGAGAAAEPDPRVAALKTAAAMAAVVEPAVGLYEEAPRASVVVETAWSDVVLTPADWLEAFDAVDPGTPHNEARDEIWEALLEIAVDNGSGEGVPRDQLRRALAGHEELRDTFRRTWPILDATDLVGDLWAVPAYLRRCAPWLDAADVQLLRRPEGSPWTQADLPLLDAMRARLGDSGAAGRRRQEVAELAADREYMDLVVQDLLDADDDPESPLPLLRRESLREDLLHTEALPSWHSDRLAGPFAHVVVDEAQELTDADWQMVLRRCPSRSVTVVGDRAQARHGFAESWRQRLRRVGFELVRETTLTVNYRTPQEVMAVAEPEIRSVLPDANVPRSIREGGAPVRYAAVAELDAILTAWLAAHDEGTACVIGHPGFAGRERVRSLDPVAVKGMEFDLVVVVDPDAFGDGINGAVDRYVAMTRATQQLVVLGR
ncbi:MAG: RNA polymerase recycling motor ATPase HelR [Propionicimonas sp.]|nr:RNA polymerase recycling motor ATPase HelR [Propionicimonas sp.]